MGESILERLQEHERWLMRRILARAQERGYTPYTSTLEEAWRSSIEGLSRALADAWAADHSPRTLSAQPATEGSEDAFAVLEARRHRERGIPLGMFLGLFKHYRDTYLDLIAEFASGEAEAARFTSAFFDRVEVSFCTEWGRESGDVKQAEMRDANRRLAAEKNRYLTIFESLPGPAIFVGETGRMENLNWAATELLLGEQSPGAGYYGDALGDRLAWLGEIVQEVLEAGFGPTLTREVDGRTANGMRRLRITGRRMLDVSSKFSGALLFLEDVTERAALQERVQMLQRVASMPALARDIAHEVNNPLSCVVANLEVLESDQESLARLVPAADLAECRAAIQGAREGAERIRLLVADMERILREQRIPGLPELPH